MSSMAVSQGRQSGEAQPCQLGKDSRNLDLTIELAGETARLVAGTAGDHPGVQVLLHGVMQTPTAAEFQAQLEHPTYEPSDRLLVKIGDRLLSHVRLTHRQVYFGSIWLPVTFAEELATAAEFRQRGCATALLRLAEESAAQQQSLAIMIRTSQPDFFTRRGWCEVGRPCYTVAAPREILAHICALDSEQSDSVETLLDPKPKSDPISIRLWRHVEQEALIRLYNNYATCLGMTQRPEAYWRWLVSRRGYDRIYAAARGFDRPDLEEAQERILGYAAMHEGRVIELVGINKGIRELLLARACGDAIERDHHTIRVDAPESDPIHQILVEAGGKLHAQESSYGERWMIKLFQPLRLLDNLRGDLWQRARESGLPRNTELGLSVDGQKMRLIVGTRSVKIEHGRLGRSYLTIDQSQLSQLLMGALDAPREIAAGRLNASTRVAGDLAARLFPHTPMWLPPLDDLPAIGD